MKKSILIILSLFLGFSCGLQKQANYGLLNDECILSNFNETSVKELENLILFLDNKLLEKTNTKDLGMIYKSFSRELVETSSVSNQKTINLISQNELEELISKLSDDTFSEVWYYEYGYDYLTKDTLSVFLNINMTGKYFKCLLQFSENNNELKEYINIVLEDGFVGPSLNATFPFFAQTLDFLYPMNRLFFAVHFYSLIYEKDFKSEIE